MIGPNVVLWRALRGHGFHKAVPRTYTAMSFWQHTVSKLENARGDFLRMHARSAQALAAFRLL
jgi:hypothetical protein